MPKQTKMPLRLYFITAVFISMMLTVESVDSAAKQKLFEEHLPVVAIDPGHGGNDSGAKGPTGILEKTVTLKLARMIAQQLEADYRVVLTRNDDYGLDYSSRTAAANHAGADLFVSLHAGSSFINDTNRSTVFFYRPFQGSAFKTESSTKQPSDNSEPAARWDMIQIKYRAASERLAIQMQSGLAAIRQPQDIVVHGIPMLVLEGADMPAVAVELGNLSNPSAEKELVDPRFLSRIAEVMVDVIKAFLEEKVR